MTQLTIRPDLARRQAELVAALTGGAGVPDGFDPGRVQVLADALRDKRARELARAWPRLVHTLGEAWPSVVAAHLRGVPSPPPSGPLGDGRLIARRLAAEGRLPWEGRLELLAADLRWRWGPDGGRSPRRYGVAVAAQLRPPRLCLAVRMHGAGMAWWKPIR